MKNNFKLFPKKSSGLPRSSGFAPSGFAQHPCSTAQMLKKEILTVYTIIPLTTQILPIDLNNATTTLLLKRTQL